MAALPTTQFKRVYDAISMMVECLGLPRPS